MTELEQQLYEAEKLNNECSERDLAWMKKYGARDGESLEGAASVAYEGGPRGLRWSRLSEQIFRFDKWSLRRG